MDKRSVGKAGEEFAAKYVTGLKMKVLERNFNCRVGEIDIIALDGDMVAFIEVKTRSGKTYGTAAEAVTPAKVKKLVKAAYEYIGRRGMGGYNYRFDVAEVYVKNTGYDINYIKNAFEVF